MKFPNTKEFYLAAGSRIREARGKSITQEQLAKAAGLSRVSVVNIEAGRQKLLLHHAIVIADVLGMSLAELIEPLLPKAGEKPDLEWCRERRRLRSGSFAKLVFKTESKIAP